MAGGAIWGEAAAESPPGRTASCLGWPTTVSRIDVGPSPGPAGLSTGPESSLLVSTALETLRWLFFILYQGAARVADHTWSARALRPLRGAPTCVILSSGRQCDASEGSGWGWGEDLRSLHTRHTPYRLLRPCPLLGVASARRGQSRAAGSAPSGPAVRHPACSPHGHFPEPFPVLVLPEGGSSPHPDRHSRQSPAAPAPPCRPCSVPGAPARFGFVTNTLAWLRAAAASLPPVPVPQITPPSVL